VPDLLLYNLLARDRYIILLSIIITYNLNLIVGITTSALNIRILRLFRASLNIFKT
jgi:hypothetical protein